MDEQDVRSNRNVVWRCHYHVVWCPKYRRRVITSDDPKMKNPPHPRDHGRAVDERLVEIIREVADEAGVIIDEIETMPDHVHMLVQVDPQYGVGTFIKRAKGRSSRILRQEFPSLRSRLPTLWTNSYFVATVGGAPLSILKQYIENQRNV